MSNTRPDVLLESVESILKNQLQTSRCKRPSTTTGHETGMRPRTESKTSSGANVTCGVMCTQVHRTKLGTWCFGWDPSDKGVVV